jgi:hypothetical protein
MKKDRTGSFVNKENQKLKDPTILIKIKYETIVSTL